MKYYSASNNAFYLENFRHEYELAGSWPNDAVKVSDVIYAEFAEGNPPVGKIRTSGQDGFPKWTEIIVTREQIESAKVAIVQRHMDDAARALRYDDIKTAVTYAEEPAVPKFQAEGQAFRAWRSLVWAKCYAILAEVQAGTREVPTDEELISELPALVLPE